MWIKPRLVPKPPNTIKWMFSEVVTTAIPLQGIYFTLFPTLHPFILTDSSHSWPKSQRPLQLPHPVVVQGKHLTSTGLFSRTPDLRKVFLLKAPWALALSCPLDVVSLQLGRRSLKCHSFIHSTNVYWSPTTFQAWFFDGGTSKNSVDLSLPLGRQLSKQKIGGTSTRAPYPVLVHQSLSGKQQVRCELKGEKEISRSGLYKLFPSSSLQSCDSMIAHLQVF